MGEQWTVVTRRGRVTIPARIRKALNLKQGDEVAFVFHAGEARLFRARDVVQRTAGALKSREPPLTAEELREEAERAIAREAVERTGDQVLP